MFVSLSVDFIPNKFNSSDQLQESFKGLNPKANY
jgi:hypothetical protein